MMTIYWQKRKELGRGDGGIKRRNKIGNWESRMHLVCITTKARGPRVPFSPDARPTIQPIFMSDPVALNKDMSSSTYPFLIQRNSCGKEMACRGDAQLAASLAFCASEGTTVLTDNSRQEKISFTRQVEVVSFRVLIQATQLPNHLTKINDEYTR
jgi:hypothetical protein